MFIGFSLHEFSAASANLPSGKSQMKYSDIVLLKSMGLGKCG